MKPTHLKMPKAIQNILALVAFLGAAATLQAAAPDLSPKQVNLGEAFLQEIRLLSYVLIVILFLLLNIVILMAVKDPSKLSLMAILRNFSGKDSPDPEMHHEYDGIKELDNPMPAWLRLLFVGSIAFAVIYMFHYQFLRTGPSSKQEYEIEMAAAALQYKDVELPPEAIIQITDPGRLASAVSIFNENCATCHGEKLQGMTGPNLTDAYWLHGGEIDKVYATITDGVPGKTMISWKRLLPSQERLALASYILSLSGSNPPGAKAPEGNLAGEAGSAAPDSSGTPAVPADTANSSPTK
jgi:mono/diheme cytochrome c family protein